MNHELFLTLCVYVAVVTLQLECVALLEEFHAVRQFMRFIELAIYFLHALVFLPVHALRITISIEELYVPLAGDVRVPEEHLAKLF